MRKSSFFPLAIFLALAGFLWKGLYLDPNKLPSALIGKPVPEFSLPSLLEPNKQLSNQIFKGKVSMLNIWASWCNSCRLEHDLFLNLKPDDKFQIIGINYKDEQQNAQTWLGKFGDPYSDSIFDIDGQLGLNLGVYGTPETFIIDKQGIIRYRHVGPVDVQVWDSIISGLIQEYANT